MASLKGLRILVIDDDPEALLLLNEILSGRGAIVRTSISATEGRAIFQEWRPDLLISDLAMPGESGIDLIKSIRVSGPVGASIPAIAITGLSDRVGTLASGYDLFVSKPVVPSELVHLIATISGRPSSPPGSPAPMQ